MDQRSEDGRLIGGIKIFPINCSSLILNPSLSEHQPCGDLQPQLGGALSPSSQLKTRITSTSPKTSSSLNTRIYVSNPVLPIDHSVDLRFSGKQSRQPLPESDLDDEQLRALLASTNWEN